MRQDRRLVTLLIVLVALITATAGPALAQGPDNNPGPDDNPGEDDDPGEDEGEDDDPGQDDENRSDDARGRAPAGVGRVSHVDGTFDGRFIDADLIDDGLANVSYDGTALLDAIRVPNMTITETRVDGARIRIEGETADGDARFRLHDTASAFARYEVDDDGRLILDLADGAEAQETDHGYTLTAGDVTARLWIEDGDLTLTNGTLSSDGEAEVKLLVSPSAVPGDQDVSGDVAEAAARGRVAAEVRMSQDNGTFRTDVARFSNISLLGSRSGNGVIVVVSSEDATGRTVVLHLDRSVIERSDDGEIEVRFDGETIGQADDLQDVLDPRADEAPEHVTVEGADGLQVLVGVPSFSPHTIEVASIPGPDIIAQTGLSATQIGLAMLTATATVAVAAGIAGKRS